MVENKHSINTILSFGAKSVNPEILEQLLTGRADIADFFEQKITAIVEEKTNQFWLIVGQRGMGKTHLLKVLHSRVWHYVEENRLVIAYFAEEEYGVANFFDFLLRILNSFIKWYDNDSEFLKSELEKLQNLPTNKQTLYLENIIKDYMKEKPLLILTENFGDILEQMGENEQGRLRAWLYDNNKVSIIATSQSVSDNFDKEDRPFYGFFVNYYLKKLSFEESLSFLISLAKLDKDEKLIEHLNGKGKAQVRAIYDLVKGNHRLLVTFYQFLKTDTVAKVSENFIKTINDLKPYYETYIRYLPPQQQKILRYIALARKPQKGVEISKNCFIEQKSLSKQLSELTKKNLLDANEDPSDKRNKFYDVSEPLLRISIEVGEHKEGITALFIDFLALYYDINELENRNSKFLKLLENCDEKDRKKIEYEIQALNKAIFLKKMMFSKEISTKLTSLAKNKKYDEIVDFFSSNKFQEEEKEILLIIIANLIFEINGSIDSFRFFKKIDIEKLQTNYYKDIFKEIFNKSSINKENIIKKVSFSYIEYGLKNKNTKLVKNGFKIFEPIKNLNFDYLIDYVFLDLKNTIDNKNNLESKATQEKLIELHNELSNKILNPKNLEYKLKVKYYVIILTIIIIFRRLYEDQNLKTIEFEKEFIVKLNSENKIEKIKLLTLYAKIGDLWLFDTFKTFIQENIINFKEVLIVWLNEIISSENPNNDQISEFLKFIILNKKQIPELAISEIYFNTYREVVLNKNKSALYELPKEQREFFEKNILKKKK